MGNKRGSWFSSIKAVFTSKHNQQPSPSFLNNIPQTQAEKKNKKGYGFPKLFYREPSSIEKILGEVDQHNLYFHSPPRLPASTANSPLHLQIITHTSQPKPQPQPQPQPELEPEPEPEPEPKSEQLFQQHHHLSATKIQAAYRRYKSRRSRLMRLQGQNVKRQTVNAMKQMQLLVRLQTQIHSRRIQMSLKPTNNHLSEMGDWDDSVITKEETQARLKKKVEAVTNRERAMSYAYSHLQKPKPKSGNGYPPYPWWWNSLERQLPPSHTTPIQLPLKNHQLPSTLTPDQKQSPRLAPSRTRQQQTTPSPNRIKSTTRGGYPMKDDDSLMSCPPFSVPNYMSPTISAKAKARPTSNPRDRVATPTTPRSVSSSVSVSVSKRRFSFPFTPPNMNKWNKHKSPGSVGDLSVDSANSVPASLGRKPFNRFV